MNKVLLIVITLISTVCALIGQSKYSGVYKVSAFYMGKSESDQMAITSSGRMFSGYEDEDDLDPYRSLVSSNGRFTAIDYEKSISFTGAIDSKSFLKGTFKYQGLTARVSGKRILK